VSEAATNSQKIEFRKLSIEEKQRIESEHSLELIKMLEVGLLMIKLEFDVP
jgi:hypothetical protein